MSEEYGGLEAVEVVRLINKKKRRYCKIALDDLENEQFTPEQWKTIRKVILDNMNSFSRSVFVVIGIDIEGLEE